MTYLRAPATPPAISPSASTSQSRYIIFRHPGYADPHNVLLKLLAPDSSSPISALGLHAGYALTACGVVAGNRWDGWLSQEREQNGDESQRIYFHTVDMETVLKQSSYYFHLPNNDDDRPHPYPIVPTFREWSFPHDRLPPSWTHPAPEAAEQTFSMSSLTTALIQRDVSCRITGYREGVQVAHICPQAEEDWYLRNGMPRYSNGNTASVDNPANALLLRADLHITFDKPKFVFVPKPAVDGEPQFAVHLVEPSRELESLYHNRALQGLGVSPELLFARFAWTIFPWLAGFLKGRIPRCLQLSVRIDGATENEIPPPLLASSEQCESFLVKSSKSRNSTPKKRGRAEDDDADEAKSLHEEERQRPQKHHRGDKPVNELSPIEGALFEAPGSLTKSPHEPSPATPDAPAQYNDPTILRQEWLKRERTRSDGNKGWEEEMAWAAEVYKGNVTLGEEDAERWLDFNGREVQDEDMFEITEKG
ncbi:hypothetical protein MMC08_002027 [Hypocenomyce scalaris]|nr:hypothetical protein [Hypocenomyce scalaris]